METIKYRVRTTAEARIDVIETTRWYESKSYGLGKRFFDEVEIIKDKLSIQPEMHRQIRPGIHRIFLKEVSLRCLLWN